MNQVFKLGQCVATCGVNDWMADSPTRRTTIMDCLSRHAQGDWGDRCAEDAQQNDEAAEQQDRLLSVYHVEDETIWIITEWDRSVTTILFPSEY